MFEAGKSLTEKAEQVRKRLQNVYSPMLRVLNCVTKWRESAISVVKRGRKRQQETDSCINSREDTVVSFRAY